MKKNYKVMIVIGTRPEAIKMALLAKNNRKNNLPLKFVLCVTGQHREMLDQVLDLFEIEPNMDLDIMSPNQDLYDISSKLILKLRDALKIEKPDLVLVHGDTTTTLIASLAAYYQKIDVGHVEAGLRTDSIYSPWPEEINRRLTSRLAKYHFAPTEFSKEILLNECIEDSNILVTGNTVIDSLIWIKSKLEKDKKLREDIFNSIQEKGYKVDLSRKMVLITGHRRENFGEKFLNVCEAIKYLAFKNPQVDFVYPVHLNPNVKKPVYAILSSLDNVHLIEPIDYASFVFLMISSYLILTDSGGIQEEAPSLGKPVLVLRDTTERPEAIKAGTCKLVGTNFDLIVKSVQNLLDNKKDYEAISNKENVYGDGNATKKIIDFLNNIYIKKNS